MTNKSSPPNRQNPAQVSEHTGANQLKQAFEALFDDVVILKNVIVPSLPGAAVKTNEMDAVVVCNAGVFVFEFKGWKNCKVTRTKALDGLWAWSLRHHQGGAMVTVRDPLQQVGGKQKALQPFVMEALIGHLGEMTNQLTQAVEVLSTPECGASVKTAVMGVVNKITGEPHVRTRTYVMLPMSGVELDLDIPPTVVTGRDLQYILRQLAHEVRRKDVVHMPFTTAMVNVVAEHLRGVSAKHSHAEHLLNIQAVHGGCEKALAELGVAAPTFKEVGFK
jgi:hypothetical protein